MLKFNLTIALRNLKKYKSSSIINIAGLAIGIGVCLAILQYIHYELSYDKFHKDSENLYRLTLDISENDVIKSRQAKTSYAMGVKAEEVIPEIEKYCRIHPQYFGAVVTNPDKNVPFLEEEQDMLYVDSTFFDVFNFPLKHGDPSNVLNDKHNIVISDEMAAKYFGKEIDPIGKILKVEGWTKEDYVVTGVLNTSKGNSHLKFDFLLPMRSLLESGEYKSGAWGRCNFYTYFKIGENSKIGNIENKLDQLVYDNFGKSLDHYNVKWELNLQQLTDIHLYSSHLEYDISNNGSIRNLKALGIIAIFILIIAWLNFINLSIANSIKRTKEVGIRKALGALKTQLRNQFIMEALIINFIAVILAIFIADLILSELNNILDSEFTFLLFSHYEFWIGLVLFTIISALISGFYPAFVMSSFQAINIQKSEFKISGFRFNLRKGLVIFQFLISSILLSGTFIIYNQITFMKSQDLGVDMEQILVVRGPELIENRETIASNLSTFKTETSKYSSIQSVTSSGNIPGKGHSAVVGMRKLGKDPSQNEPGGISFVDYKFFDTYELEFLAGEPFDRKTVSDYTYVILNQQALQTYELGSPEEALNEQIVVGDDTVLVAGVLKDFHWQSLKEDHMPILFVASDGVRRYFSFKINTSNIEESLSQIRSAYNEKFAGNPFEYFFLDDEFNYQYRAELQFGKIFMIFSLIAIFIACMGLFAFVSFSTVQRTKEMGIRKILGARVSTLILILSKEYLTLLLMASLISVPIVFYISREWLTNFAFKMNLSVDLFIIPTLILIVISFLTVVFNLYKTAKINPTESLKIE
ncbi:ABC transporter permease [Marivirga salinae]|uniref:ABC transporter permease n=1 Tax=Marivirga salinarum TaxID=3059078 RepID=A0AA51NCR8_9BACT|nr:ABC transporter permease [Marivirga sp. BDSF4-3]WMN12982.1 ABC transporter permease [Marivirga sp. BDSF4-3]